MKISDIKISPNWSTNPQMAATFDMHRILFNYCRFMELRQTGYKNTDGPDKLFTLRTNGECQSGWQPRLSPSKWCAYLRFRDVNFPEFYFSIREFKSRDSSSTQNLTLHLACTMHLMRHAWMLQLSRYHATQLWLGGGPWEVKQAREGKLWRCQIIKRACLSHVLVVRPDRHTAVILDSSHAVAVIAQQWADRVALTSWAMCTV